MDECRATRFHSFPFYTEHITGTSYQIYTNSEQALQQSSSFNSANSDNAAKFWKIDGLGPILRNIENDNLYVLKDAKGYFYLFDEDVFELLAFSTRLEDGELMAILYGGIRKLEMIEDGELIDASDEDKTIPVKMDVNTVIDEGTTGRDEPESTGR